MQTPHRYSKTPTKRVFASKRYWISQCNTQNTLGTPHKIQHPTVSPSRCKIKLPSSNTYIHFTSKRRIWSWSFSSSWCHSSGVSSDFKWSHGSICNDSVSKGILRIWKLLVFQKMKVLITNIEKLFSSSYKVLFPLFLFLKKKKPKSCKVSYQQRPK